MSSIAPIARKFFEACETGKGWTVCLEWCRPEATFAAQAEPLADVRTLQHYTEWMKRLLTFIPDGHFKLKSFATDDERNDVSAYAVFRGTDTGEGAVPINGQDRLVRLRVRDVLRRRQDHAHAKDLACRPDDGAEN